MSARAPRVGVVIVNYNAGEHLGHAVESLLAQTTPPDRIVVVDNGSDDGSVEGFAMRFPSVELVAAPANIGFAAGNNLGVGRCADCELVALLNPDAFPQPTWLETLVAAADRHPEYAVFGSRLVLDADDRFLDGTGDCYHVNGVAFRRDGGASSDVIRETAETFSACAAAALYRREAFLGVGGFDESFFCYYEDTDLSFRLRLAGQRSLYVADAVARHVGSATAGIFSEFTVYHSARNRVWVYAKNMPSGLFWLYLPQHLLMNTLIVVMSVPLRRAGAALAGNRDAIRDLPRILRERRRIQAGRHVGALALRRSMSRGLGIYLLPFVLWARAQRRRRDAPAAVVRPSPR
jgi:GT2 family glycosyltransferase